MMEQAPSMAIRNSKAAVHTQTLHSFQKSRKVKQKNWHKKLKIFFFFFSFNGRTDYQAAHARNRFRPRSDLSLAKLNMNVYMMTVGSATPRISKGWPPMIEWMMPQSAVEAKV